MEVPRYSREDMAAKAQELRALMDDLWSDGVIGLIARSTLSTAATMLSGACRDDPEPERIPDDPARG